MASETRTVSAGGELIAAIVTSSGRLDEPVLLEFDSPYGESLQVWAFPSEGVVRVTKPAA